MEPTAHEKLCCLEQATLAKDFLSFVTRARETMKKYELDSQASKYELSLCQQEVIALRGSVEKVSALEEELIRHRAVESELRSSFEMERLGRGRMNAELDRTNALLRQTALFCIHQGVTARCPSGFRILVHQSSHGTDRRAVHQRTAFPQSAVKRLTTSDADQSSSRLRQARASVSCAAVFVNVAPFAGLQESNLPALAPSFEVR